MFLALCGNIMRRGVNRSNKICSLVPKVNYSFKEEPYAQVQSEEIEEEQNGT